MKRLITLAAALVALCSVAFAQGPRPNANPDYVVLSQRAGYNGALPDGRSTNFAPTFFIYPDTKLSESQAKDLIAEFDFQDVIDACHVTYFVINPVGDKYDNVKDEEAFIEMFNRARSGNLKVIGIGNGATFVNSVIAPKSCGYIAGILTIEGKPAKGIKGSYPGVPAYVAGKSALKVAPEYVTINSAVKNGSLGTTAMYINEEEPLLQVGVNAGADGLSAIFHDAWDKVLGGVYRFNNYKHTHYEGCAYGQFGVYELEPYVNYEKFGLERVIKTQPQRGTDPWLWYEYWPTALKNAPAKSVPVMVLLHGNTNDPRTQAETSGFLEIAAKERFMVVEMEWQGREGYAAMGHDGVESVLITLFNTYPQLDPSRVYAEGLSAGSMTATQLGVKKSHIFTAVGGHSGGAFGTIDPVTNALYAEATQKRGAVEVPYCSVLGTADNVVPFFNKDNYKTNGYFCAWNTYQQMNGLPVIRDLDFSVDPVFGFKVSDRKTIKTNKGEGISIEFGQQYKGNVPMIRFVIVNDYGHWNFKPTAQIMWDFFKMYSRDPETKKLIYHGN